MELFPKLAAKVVSEVHRVIKEDVIVVDRKGVIIASTQAERVGSFHEGAWQVVHTKQKLDIDETVVKRLKGVQMGINMPILFEGRVIGVIGITGYPKEVEPFAELIRYLTELIIREASFAEQIEWKTRGMESYVFEWVNAGAVDQEFIDRGLMLGIPMQSTFVCCLIQITPANEDEQDVQSLERETFALLNQSLQNHHDYLIRWGNGRFLLLANRKESSLKEELYSRFQRMKRLLEDKMPVWLSIGVGKTVSPFVIHPSYKEAKKALQVAKKNHSVVFYEDLLLEIVLTDVLEETRKEFLERTIHQLSNNHDLIETLQVYIAHHQSMKETASVMHIHVNTLHYRLRQIKEITGIDPKQSVGLVLFTLAFLLMDR